VLPRNVGVTGSTSTTLEHGSFPSLQKYPPAGFLFPILQRVAGKFYSSGAKMLKYSCLSDDFETRTKPGISSHLTTSGRISLSRRTIKLNWPSFVLARRNRSVDLLAAPDALASARSRQALQAERGGMMPVLSVHTPSPRTVRPGLRLGNPEAQSRWSAE